MRYLTIALFALSLAACAPEESSAPNTEPDPGPVCPEPEAPADCPAARVADSVDLRTGCPTLVCGPCPQVEIPACDEGVLQAERDEATDCPIAWVCERCEEPPVPTCPDGYPVAEEDPATGCVTAWSCAACPAVEEPGCSGAEEELDPVTGCTAAWRCPECPEIEEPSCEFGDPALVTDPTSGCPSWECPACPDPEPPVCDFGTPEEGTDPETGCTTWSCPTCPEVESPGCEGAVEHVDPETGCTSHWTCPGDPWAAVAGLNDDALIDGLQQLIDDHTVLGYNGARDEMFEWLDVHNGKIECIYTGRLVEPNGSRTPGGFNTEHSWPQSHGATGVAKSDIHHLFPTDSRANSYRSNLDFGWAECSGGCSFEEGGSEMGPSTSGGGNVFEVRSAYRGDIARAHFYFSVRYGMSIGQAEEGVLRDWHDEDPPSARERLRNDRIEMVQDNRNPFVDRPDFVDRIADF